MRKLTPEEKEISRQRNLERMRKWQQEHKEELKEKRRKWLLEKKQNDPEWYEKQKAHSREYQKVKRETDPEYVKRQNEKTREWHKLHYAERYQEQYEKRKEYFSNYTKERYKNNKDYRIQCRTCQTKDCWRDGERHLIENYDKALADEFKGWVLHHRLECTIDGEFAHSAEELKRMGMYYNRPYYELIYLTRSEHSKLHYRSGHSLSNKRSRGK